MKGTSKRKSKKRWFIASFFRLFFLFIYFLLFVSLLLSLSAKFISSEVSFIPSLLALAFPFLFAVFFILTIIVIWRKYYLIFTISLPLLIWSFVVFDRYINFSSFLKKSSVTILLKSKSCLSTYDCLIYIIGRVIIRITKQ